MTTALAGRLTALIRESGPISLSEYMTLCLSDPEHGYYATRDPFGARGDFTTAPEISQMFGELIGLCLVQAWVDRGSPTTFCLAELGPGRGTLMADILRASSVVPAFAQSAKIAMVETSPALRERQTELLGTQKAMWVSDVANLPDEPLFVVANEFFDALPIRQFQRVETGWREVKVGLVEGALAFGLGDTYDFPPLKNRITDTRPGDIVEISPAAQDITKVLADRIAHRGGAAVFVDYGGARSLGDTFQAVRNHISVSPLESPGDADLTAHVDFGALTDCAGRAGLVCSALTPQGVFLERLGIATRAKNLARSLSGKGLEAHVAAHRRLTHPAEMGTVFKVLGLTGTNTPPLPGLSP